MLIIILFQLETQVILPLTGKVTTNTNKPVNQANFKNDGFQAAGATISNRKPVPNPETIATAIRIGNPASWNGAIDARDTSGGIIDKVTDDELTHAQKLIASQEGIFFEPACGASIAGVLNTHKKTPFKKEDVIVSTVTGHGLKDPNRAIEMLHNRH